MHSKKYLHWLLVLVTTLLVQACGGGGGGGSSSTPSSSSSSSSNTPLANNAVSVTVSTGLSPSTTNMVMTSVTLCRPGSSTSCVTIPNIQVDTGSTGLRVFASTLASLSLPPITSGTTGDTIYNCTAFGDGVVWGSMATADVKLGNETASAIGVHILQDTGVGAPIPTQCSQQGSNETSILGTTGINAFGVNGIIGVGLYNQDCGSLCATSTYPSAPKYYDCTSSHACTPTTATLTQQTVNPVAFFSTDNTGVALQLPTISDYGVASATGTLFFGIGTQTNNTESASAVKISVPYASSGYFTANYQGTSLPQSFIDSGSSGYYFNAAILTCSTQTAYFCPGGSSASLSPLSLSVNFPNSNTNGTTLISNMVVASADYLFSENNGTYGAFNDIGAPNTGMPNSFDFGVPFFFGRTVFTSNENVGDANMHFAFQPYP